MKGVTGVLIELEEGKSSGLILNYVLQKPYIYMASLTLTKSFFQL